jgi:hypothetical protein
VCNLTHPTQVGTVSLQKTIFKYIFTILYHFSPRHINDANDDGNGIVRFANSFGNLGYPHIVFID